MNYKCNTDKYCHLVFNENDIYRFSKTNPDYDDNVINLLPIYTHTYIYI